MGSDGIVVAWLNEESILVMLNLEGYPARLRGNDRDARACC